MYPFLYVKRSIQQTVCRNYATPRPAETLWNSWNSRHVQTFSRVITQHRRSFLPNPPIQPGYHKMVAAAAAAASECDIRIVEVLCKVRVLIEVGGGDECTVPWSEVVRDKRQINGGVVCLVHRSCSFWANKEKFLHRPKKDVCRLLSSYWCYFSVFFLSASALSNQILICRISSPFFSLVVFLRVGLKISLAYYNFV